MAHRTFCKYICVSVCACMCTMLIYRYIRIYKHTHIRSTTLASIYYYYYYLCIYINYIHFIREVWKNWVYFFLSKICLFFINPLFRRIESLFFLFLLFCPQTTHIALLLLLYLYIIIRTSLWSTDAIVASERSRSEKNIYHNKI